MNKKQLYETIMRNVSHEVKKALNENQNNAKYDFYSVRYIETFIDGYGLCSGEHIFKTYEAALAYIKNEIEVECISNCYIDYVKHEQYEWDKEDGYTLEDELYDVWNDGGVVVGYLVLEGGNFEG
ncbi:MAG: hypothetical protein [Wendovervirus sonii]|uniref:Phage protein n=1 Tax=phage Lak_Megaphage_Sonny TaxID=3109229 RepID=A0ABZ0Z6S5_9CAUD|nr:MAG: hypothetical protein [phage Lak_Megaphage_Sonny]